MQEIHKAYIAGIIDGEGSIMLEKFHKNQHPSPCVTIASTSLELLTWILNTTKMGNIKSKKNYNSEKHKDSYTYILRYNNAIKLLKMIYPYLIINSKKERARIIIEEYRSVTPRNGRYSEEMLYKKQLLYDKFINIV